jgi:serine/threonine-protein kinase
MMRPEDAATRFAPDGGTGETRPPDRARRTPASDFDDGGFAPGALLLGRYRIVALLGRGGMGEVYRAQDLKLGQTVALKFLPESMRDQARLERFLNEVRIARQISHPNVCRVYDVADVDGRHFLSMEFVDGEDLASLLTRIGRLPPDKGAEVARQICAGLAAAHDRGVLHRDLKPANIMIDGRGHARLADFGLAAVAHEVRGRAEFAGTPAYMAPEQIEGREISTRTDLYALGLVLHELFTGKRVFTGASVAELREQHRQRSTSASSLTQSSADLDPAIDRVIQRCLDPDPGRRPASALAVAAALPGGDPLAAALAAGETPSPELVAGSGEIGALAPRAGWALLLWVVGGVALTAWLAGQVRFYRLVPDMRSPEVLASRAGDLLDSLGYGAARPDETYGWMASGGLANYVRTRDQSVDRWDTLARDDAPIVMFWFRRSPRALVPYNMIGNVNQQDPPLLDPGMVNLRLTPRGRLVRLRGVPTPSTETGPPDWSPLFAAAGITAATLTAVEPQFTPHTFADWRAAWEGPYPNRPDWRMRVEAAARGTRVVWFEVAGPWDPPAAAPAASAAATRDVLGTLRRLAQIGIATVALLAGAWLARRNLRAGRADTRGAWIVAVWTGVSLFLSAFFTFHHSADLDAEFQRLLNLIGPALYWGVLVWLVYLALEPFLRRRWPEALVSWTRLLAGRLRDPLVGRDVLIGLAVGFALTVVGDLIDLIPEWAGRAPGSPLNGTGALGPLGTLGAFLGAMVRRMMLILEESLVILLVLLLIHALARRRWLGNAIFVALMSVFFVDPSAPLVSLAGAVVLTGSFVLVISRVGVLAFMATMLVIYSVNDLPLVFDPGAWYAGRGAIVAALFIALAAWGFHAALARRPAFGLD